MKWLIGLMFGRILDRMAAEAVDEFHRLSHCHRCGRCVCWTHTALSDDTLDEQRVVCPRCAA